MKKLIFFFALFLSIWSVKGSDSISFTQTRDNSPIKQYTPQKGALSIGIDVLPIINFVGNAFNGYGTDGTKNELQSIGSSVINLDNIPKASLALMGRYFTSDYVALRLNVGVLGKNNKQRAYVLSDVLAVTDPLSDEKLVDCISNTLTGGSLGIGVELRRGKNKIQGILGCDIIGAWQSQKDVFDYANTMTLVNTNPTSSSIMPDFDEKGYRTIEKNNGTNIYMGAACDFGIEYFIAPQLSIGTELGLTLYYKISTSSYEKREGYNALTNMIDTRNVISSPGNRSLVFGTENWSNKIYLMFYF